jgi:hypothetical protein
MYDSNKEPWLLAVSMTRQEIKDLAQRKTNDHVASSFVAFIAHDESHSTTMHSLDDTTRECVINRNRFNCMNNTMGCLLLDNY